MVMNKKQSADETVLELPDDIIRQIFLRLPSRNVYRCKCLSKAWRSIISDPQFQQDYRAHNRLNIGLLISVPHREGIEFKYSPLRFREQDAEQFCSRFKLACEQITQVVKGLVCFYNQDRLHVFNIHTNRFSRLPKNKYHERFFFGYDPVGGMYKVMGVDSLSTDCEILTLGRYSAWRKLPDNVDAPIFCNRNLVCDLSLSNGFIYWQCQSSLWSFDLNKEKFHSIDLPQGYLRLRDQCSYSLVQFKDRMTLAEKHASGLKLHVLEDEKGNSWTEHFIPFPSEFKEDRLLGDLVVTVGNLPSGHLLLANPFVSRFHKGEPFTAALYAYDHQSNKWERFVVGGFPDILTFYWKLHCPFISCIEENV